MTARTLSLIGATLTTAAAIIVPAATSSTGWRIVTKATASGDYASALAHAVTVQHPKALAVRAYATPNQPVDVSWSLLCGKTTNGSYGNGSKDGKATLRSGQIRRMRFPMARPDHCIVNAMGSLDQGGRLRVQVLAR
jgi:hypothetical protein